MGSPPASDPVVADLPLLERALLAHHARFLDFLARRTRNRAEGEDVLHSAYLRAMERGLPEDGEDGVVAWFHGVLRNAVIDGHRRIEAASRGLGALAAEPSPDLDEEVNAAVCGCIHDVLPALKAEYSDLIRSVDLDERTIPEVAAELHITPNNASVRLHRARKAVRGQLLRTCGACATHGCLDCQCRGHRMPPGT